MFWKKPLFLTLISLLAVTLLGLGSKFYSGLGQEWVNNSWGGVFYEIFWCLFFFAFFPRQRAIAPIAISVFIVTCGVEFLQLLKTPWLEAMRSHLIGRLLLGTTFVVSDFWYYAIGCILGYGWMKALSARSRIL